MAKTTGNKRRTLVTAVSFRAQALEVFYHRRWLLFKGHFWSTVAEVVRLRSCLKSYDFSYVANSRRSCTPVRDTVAGYARIWAGGWNGKSAPLLVTHGSAMTYGMLTIVRGRKEPLTHYSPLAP